MKKLLTLCSITAVLLFRAVLCFGQASTVSGLIQDPTTQPFANGTCGIKFTPVPGQTGPYFVNGAPFNQLPACSIDLSGNISATVTRTDMIVPTGSQWQFTVCPNADAQCTSVNTTVTSNTFNAATVINPQIPAISVFNTSNIPRAYSDAEIAVTPREGQVYFNTTDGILRIWNGTIWSTVGTPGGVNTQVQYNNSGTFGGFGAWDGNTLVLTPTVSDIVPTVTPNAAGGGQTWFYWVVALLSNGNHTGTSDASTTDGPATLDVTHFNTISWTGIPQASGGYDIFREISGGTPSTLGKIGHVASGTTSFVDNGVAADGTTAFEANSTGSDNFQTSKFIAANGDTLFDFFIETCNLPTSRSSSGEFLCVKGQAGTTSPASVFESQADRQPAIMIISGTTGGASRGIVNRIETTGGTGDITSGNAYEAEAVVNGTGGNIGPITFYTIGQITSGGRVLNDVITGYFVPNLSTVGGTNQAVAASYGLHIADQGSGAGNKAIKVDGGVSEFDGPIQPAAAISGQGRVYFASGSPGQLSSDSDLLFDLTNDNINGPNLRVQIGKHLVADLTCAAGLEGTFTRFTDSTVPFSAAIVGNTVVGGGVNHLTAVCDGTNWRIMAP